MRAMVLGGLTVRAPVTGRAVPGCLHEDTHPNVTGSSMVSSPVWHAIAPGNGAFGPAASFAMATGAPA